MISAFIVGRCLGSLPDSTRQLLPPPDTTSYLINPPVANYCSTKTVMYAHTEDMIRERLTYSDWPLFEMVRIVWCTFLLFIEYYERDIYAVLMLVLVVIAWRRRSFIWGYITK